MTRLTNIAWFRTLWLGGLFFILGPGLGYGADSPAPILSPGTAQAATALTLADVVRIALEYHSSIKSAEFQTKADGGSKMMADWWTKLNDAKSTCMKNQETCMNTCKDMKCTDKNCKMKDKGGKKM